MFAALLAMPAGASAQTISFGALPGSNGSAFSSYTESGFTVDLIAGSICVAKLLGNSVPALFGGIVCNQTTNSSLRIKRTAGGVFRFLSTDLATNIGSSSYTFAGYLAAASLYSTSSNFSLVSATFANFASPNSATDIDELRISLNTIDASSYNIDNIALSTSTVPEPSTVALMGAGLMGLLAVARRRKA